jgi:NAD(P)-dependent dehydrogenase (short-subunit alcohol dehydrogenase family)
MRADGTVVTAWIYLYNRPAERLPLIPSGRFLPPQFPSAEVPMQIDLSSRTAIVTGGSKGLGLGIATRFAASGADVVIAGRGREALDAAVASIGKVAKGKVVAAQGDVSVADDVKRIYNEAMKAFGKIDIVVNNAGTSRAGPFENLTDEILQTDLDQKLFAAVRLTRLVWPQMKERKWGRVINVLATGAKTPRANSAPTTISRAAGMALTKVLAGEGAPFNILVNALLVGFIHADQHVQAAATAGISLEEYMAPRVKEIPLRRIGQPEEFANIACFLASEQASYIAGTAINVDGGHSPAV